MSRAIFALALALACAITGSTLSGCAVFGHNDSPSMADEFPAGLEQQCEKARVDALAHLQRRLPHDYQQRYGWTVKIVPAGSLRGNAAETQGRTTKVTENHVRPNVLAHEGMHYWMNQNGLNDPLHNRYPEVWR